MAGFLYFLIPIALLATLLILAVGIYSLAKGGAFAKEHSNRLMRYRVMAQAVAIGLMALFLIAVGAGPGS